LFVTNDYPGGFREDRGYNWFSGFDRPNPFHLIERNGDRTDWPFLHYRI